MTRSPACSLRDALAEVRDRTPQACHVHGRPLSRAAIAADFAARHAGIPANGLPRAEDVALYATGEDAEPPVLLGLYGDRDRVRRWLPGLPACCDRAGADRLLAARQAPVRVSAAPCQDRIDTDADLSALPVLRTTPRDAGPYVTMGVLYAQDPESGETALSIHRMLVLDHERMTVWMLPSRRLRELYAKAIARGETLPVTVNIGAPPAAVIASALGTRFLPEGVSKLDIAGALAGHPIAMVPAVSQNTLALAESEIVLEGRLDDQVADECLGDGGPGPSLPEFLGYDGNAQPRLPVLTVTAVTTRHRPLYQAVIGPGREQSTILGIAGAVSVALSLDGPAAEMVGDVRFSAAGGGMLLLFAHIRKTTPEDDGRLAAIARQLFERHGFVKLIVFTDEDINIASEEDVFWALTTRANLGVDCTTLDGFPNLGMDPSQRAGWLAARGGRETAGRTFIDATTPYALRGTTARSFPSTAED